MFRITKHTTGLSTEALALMSAGLLAVTFGCGSDPGQQAPAAGGGGLSVPGNTSSSSGNTSSSSGADAGSSTSSSGSGSSTSSSSSGGNDAATSSSSGGNDAGSTTSSSSTSSGGTDAGSSTSSSSSSSSSSGGTDAGSSTSSSSSSSSSSSGGADAGSSTSSSSSSSSSGGADAGNNTGPKCVDADGDGYGTNCSKGADCDDKNPNFSVICPDCSKANYEGCPCQGVAANCYSGEATWLGKGVCQAGVQLCKENAKNKKKYWGVCQGEVLPKPESCDGKDNNCNGLIDEGVLSTCGTCDMSCTLQQVGPDYGNPFDVGNAHGVNINKKGYLYLDSKKSNINLNHIWIAGTGSKVVSKLNTKTGQEEARFHACNSASRTSVDLNGDVWVGCRSGGQVMKIINDHKFCVDKNGNGVIDTSKDLNGNGTIQSNEMKPYGQDECVRFIVRPDNSENTIRAAGVDKDNHAWVGGWNRRYLWRLNPNAGNVVSSINIGCNPYGLVIDQKGIIWVSGRGCSSLVRVDPKTKAIKKVGHHKGSPYGINVDMFGNIWIANTNQYTSRYEPKTGKWNGVAHQMRSRGVATSNDGHVYVALDMTSQIAMINAVTLNTVSHISLGGGRYPVGIAVDYDGYVWAINQSKSSASKVDPKKKQILGEYPVGKSPYTYSDMTGYTLNNYTAPKGNFTHVFGFSGWGGTVAESKTTTIWEMINVEATIPPKAHIKIRYKVGNTLKELQTKPWSKDLGPFPPQQFPINLKAGGKKVEGRFLKIELFMQAGDNKLSPLVKALAAKGKQVVVK